MREFSLARALAHSGAVLALFAGVTVAAPVGGCAHASSSAEEDDGVRSQTEAAAAGAGAYREGELNRAGRARVYGEDELGAAGEPDIEGALERLGYGDP